MRVSKACLQCVEETMRRVYRRKKVHCILFISPSNWEIALSTISFMVVTSSPLCSKRSADAGAFVELCLNRCMEGAGSKPALERLPEASPIL